MYLSAASSSSAAPFCINFFKAAVASSSMGGFSLVGVFSFGGFSSTLGASGAGGAGGGGGGGA